MPNLFPVDEADALGSCRVCSIPHTLHSYTRRHSSRDSKSLDMSLALAQSTFSTRGGLAPLLTTLPSEIRRLIVWHLAPASDDATKPGSKIHLQNANLTHPCLREWATEYLFRDMTLNHVLPGIACHLERFAVCRPNSPLLKYVRHIVVQVRVTLEPHQTLTQQ